MDLYALGQSAAIGITHALMIAAGDSSLGLAGITDFLREVAVGRLAGPGEFGDLLASENELEAQALAAVRSNPSPARISVIRADLLRQSKRHVAAIMESRMSS
jgi:hypothetical protein